MFTLDLGIKDKGDIDEVFAICNEIEQILETNRVSSGYGFGMRDMQFEFNTKLEAVEAKNKVKEIFIKHDLKLSKMDSYISVYNNEENK